jgi:hypothetical protein
MDPYFLDDLTKNLIKISMDLGDQLDQFDKNSESCINI